MFKKATACFCIFSVVLGLTGCNSDGNSVKTNKEVTPQVSMITDAQRHTPKSDETPASVKNTPEVTEIAPETINTSNPGIQGKDSDMSEIKVNDYVFRKYHNKDSDGMDTYSYKIFKGSNLIHSTDEWVYDSTVEMNPVIDITGDGVPDLIISSYIGGAHGGFTYSIFHLGKEMTVTNESSSVGEIEFADLDKDGVYELSLLDTTFAYWKAPFAGSHFPTVILKHENNKYILAQKLMTNTVVKDDYEKQIKSISEIIKAEELKKPEEREAYNEWGIPSEMWAYMLDLIYSGNGESAWDFLEKVWPAEKEGKSEFLMQFKEQLSKGAYWNEVKAMNGWN